MSSMTSGRPGNSFRRPGVRAGRRFFALLAAAGLSAPLAAQQAPRSAPTAENLAVAVAQAEAGHCAAALPRLAAFPHAANDALRRRAGADAVRCAALLGRASLAADDLGALRRLYPHDPEVLYLAVHIYSDLATEASQELVRTHPAAYQVHELNAEALESQGQWDAAAAEYRAVLKRDPNLPGIHYRLGRVLLSKPHASAAELAAAEAEFKAELKIDPGNAGAEYVLGDMAFAAHDWTQAITRFTRATQLDPGLADAWLGLGRAWLAQDLPAKAVVPLQRAVRLAADNPTPHYYLALAYSRTNRPAEARREMELQRQALAQAQARKDRIQQGTP